MRFIIVQLIMILLFMSGISNASETYFTACVEGIVPLEIDGDLSDWEWINVIPVSINNFKEYEKPDTPTLTKEFSSTFYCFIDDNNFYGAFIVKDSRIIFDKTQGGKPFWDDAVEIVLFDSHSLETSQAKIWVSADSEGKTELKGREPESTNPNYPYLREKWGIKAALLLTEEGYTVEISIPLTVLSEWISWSKDTPLRVNLRVYDDNSDGNENYLEWAYNPLNVTNNYHEIAFTETLISIHDVQEQKSNTTTNTSEILVELEEPDIICDRDFIIARELESNIRIATAFEKNKKYSWAIKRLENILKSTTPKEIELKTKLALARNYFFINNYESAQQVCNELLNSDIDSKTQLDVKMILLSIDRKKKLDKLF